MYAIAKCALRHCSPNGSTFVAVDRVSSVRDSWPGRSPFKLQLLAKLSALTGCRRPGAGCEAPSTALEPFVDALCFVSRASREATGNGELVAG